jgi:hypothetical protein
MMRKALLCTLLVLSVNSYGQIKHANLYTERLSGRTTYHKKIIKQGETKAVNISSGLNQIKSSGQLVPRSTSFTPIYDDIYYWKRDIPGKKWVFDSRTINLVYDIDYNLISYVDQIWSGGIWVNDQQETDTYVDNKITGEVWQKWNGAIWVNDYNYISTYNANGKVSGEIGQLWNGSSWVNDYQSIYTYDSNNNLIKLVQQLWDGSVWVDSYQEISTFNSDNNIDYKLSQFSDGSAWTNSTRDYYFYNTDKKVNRVLEETYTVSEVWESYSQTTLTYDVNNNISNKLMETWNGAGWENYTNDILTYDASNNLKTLIEQMWDEASWIQSIRQANTYDINNFVLSETTRSWTNSILTSGDSTYYDFHTIVTGIDDRKTESLKIYPNPGSGKFTIESSNKIDKVEVYNLSGGLVTSDLQGKQQGSFVIDLTYCTKGLYIFKVYIGAECINKKVIIK